MNTMLRYIAYKVRPGDTFSEIVREYTGESFTSEKLRQIYNLNADRIPDPNIIHPNDIILLKVIND